MMMRKMPTIFIFFEILIMNLVTIALERNGTECNPSNKYLLGQFLMHHFDAARSELTLTPQFKLSNDRSDAENFNYKTSVEKVLLGIFSFSNGVVINYEPKFIRPIPYARIIFNGEEKVLDYLHRLVALPSSPNSNRRPQSLQHSNVKYKNHLELLLSAMSVSEAAVNEKGLSIQTILDSPVSNVGVVPVLSFVRDPLDRFFHGYCDAMSKPPPTSKGGGNTTLESPRDAATKLGRVLEDILSYKEPFPRASAMLFPMAGTFFEFQVDLIGKYEHLSTDLQEIGGVYHFPQKQDRRSLTPKEKDSSGSNSNSKKEQNPKNIQNNNKNNNKNKNNKKVASSNGEDSDAQMEEGNNRKEAGVAKQAARLREVLQLSGSPPQHQRFMRAICHLLLIDYVCLPMYKLPAECHFLNDARRAATEALKKKKNVI